MKDLLKIRKDYYLMVFALFFMKTGQFMSLPFLAIYLRHSLTPSLIGLVIGVGAFTYGFSGILAGIVADKLGVKKSLTLALIIGGVALLCFFLIHQIIWYIVMSIVFGIGRSIFNVSSKAYGVTTYEPKVRRLCFSVRNMMVDAAAGVGPLIGAVFAVRGSTYAFPVVGIVYFVLAVFAIIFLKDGGRAKEQIPINEAIKTLSKDRLLQILIVIFFLYWVCFSQIDSTLPLYLSSALPNGIHVYTAMLVIEAIGCVLLQLLFTYITRNMKDSHLGSIGMLLFGIGYTLFAFFLNVPLLILAIIVIIFGQIIILPLNDLLISKLAPPHQMSTYYGTITLAAVGMGIGPFIGGMLYQHIGPMAVFLFCTLLCLIAIGLYWPLAKGIKTRNLKEQHAHD